MLKKFTKKKEIAGYRKAVDLDRSGLRRLVEMFDRDSEVKAGLAPA